MGKGSFFSFYTTVSLLCERVYVCVGHTGQWGLSLSSEQAWRILCLESEKEHRCPEQQIFFLFYFFFCFGLLEVCSVRLSGVIWPQRPLSISFEP